MDSYLPDVKKQFLYYKTLGEKTINQLDEEDLFWQFNEESNSVAIIVSHLAGNMLSRWTDFLSTDGEKEWRHRDKEFEQLLSSKDELMQSWQKGWNCLFEALGSLDDSDLERVVLIRNQEHSVVEAINRQLAHYAMHVGQIIYIGKMIKGSSWKSLSIPKGQSERYNQSRLDKGKHGGHFTDDRI